MELCSFPYEVIDTDPDCLKRLKSASEIKPTKFSIDRVACFGVFQGSSPQPYTTSLSGCTCKDYAIRCLPCKHMYRLAMELGYPSPIPKYDPVAAAVYDPFETIDQMKARWRAGQITTDTYITCLSALSKEASKR